MLNQRVNWITEKFSLRSKGVVRPLLTQIENSLSDTKENFSRKDGVTVIPSNCPSHLAEIRDRLLQHLKTDSYLYDRNIVTGTPLDCIDVQNIPSLMVLMDSLVLAIDFEIPARPSNVIGDVFLAISGQPVIVLTIVDDNCIDNSFPELTSYNTSIARGVTSKLKQFMDENFAVVFGICCLDKLANRNDFYESVKAHAESSSYFIPQVVFECPPTKYDDIVTAFWASVATTKSVFPNEDTDCIRLLTKEQCILLVENINNKEVKVQYQPRSGATTLMLEVARRLSRFEDTLLVCGSLSERDQLSLYSLAFPKITIKNRLNSEDLSTHRNVIYDTEPETCGTQGRCWQFTPYQDGKGSPRNIGASWSMRERQRGVETRDVHAPGANIGVIGDYATIHQQYIEDAVDALGQGGDDKVTKGEGGDVPDAKGNFGKGGVSSDAFFSEEYNMKFPKRGIAVIFNNRDFDKNTQMGTRTGTDVDAANIFQKLKALGFEMIFKENQTKSEMKTLMRSLGKEDHSQNDCFACVILSHGEEGTVYGKDGPLEIKELVEPFKGHNCKSLAGKPKLFFIQACRGQGLDDGITVSDALGVKGDGDDVEMEPVTYRIPTEADFLMAYSVVPGYFSWRNSSRGSWFMQALCQVLEKYGTTLDLMTMMTRVNKLVAYEFESNASKEFMNRKKQIPCITSMLTKDVYFRPKN